MYTGVCYNKNDLLPWNVINATSYAYQCTANIDVHQWIYAGADCTNATSKKIVCSGDIEDGCWGYKCDPDQIVWPPINYTGNSDGAGSLSSVGFIFVISFTIALQSFIF